MPDKSSASSTDDSFNDVDDAYENFLYTLHRVTMRDDRPLVSNVKKLLQDSRRETETVATREYLAKELDAACNPAKYKDIPGTELEEQINYLQLCINNRAGVEFAAQNVYINTQLQDELHDQLAVNTSTAALDSKLATVLDQSKQSLECSSEVSRVLDEIDAHHVAILLRRAAVTQTHEEVRQLWLEKEERDLTRHQESDTPLITQLREKLRDREGRIQLLVYFMQTLVTGLVPNWGTNPRMIRILEACELYTSQGRVLDAENIIELLAN